MLIVALLCLFATACICVADRLDRSLAALLRALAMCAMLVAMVTLSM